MTKINQTYVRVGRDLLVQTHAEGDVLSKLPPGHYRLEFSPLRGWYFVELQSITMPEKLYGSVTTRANRILHTYRDRMSRGEPTGILLSGTKGAGKTLLSKKIAVDSGLPVVSINSPYCDDQFKEIVSNLGPCILIFDEFEKVYKETDDQNNILALLSGLFTSQVLSIVIVNDAGRLVDPLINRPGRLYYSLDYGGLEKEFIDEYVADKLDMTKHASIDHALKEIHSIASMLVSFTFDQLQAIVEEMNRYGETAREAITYLNVKIPSPMTTSLWKIVKIVCDGKDITEFQKDSDLIVTDTPFTTYVSYSFFTEDPEHEDVDDDDDDMTRRDLKTVYTDFGSDALYEANVEKGTFTFKDGSIYVTYKKLSDYKRPCAF